MAIKLELKNPFVIDLCKFNLITDTQKHRSTNIMFILQSYYTRI